MRTHVVGSKWSHTSPRIHRRVPDDQLHRETMRNMCSNDFEWCRSPVQSQSYKSVSAVEIPSVPIPLKGSSELGHPLWERFRSSGVEACWNATWQQYENAFWRLHQNVVEGIATCHDDRPIIIFIAKYGGSAFSCVSNKRQHKKTCMPWLRYVDKARGEE